MLQTWTLVPLMAREGAWDPSWWPHDSSTVPLHLVGYLMLALALAVVARLAVLYGAWLARKTRPLRVFLAVAGELGLSWRQRWRLWRIAQTEGLLSPLTLLMSPVTLSSYAEQHLARLPAVVAAGPRRQVEAIHATLFGSDEQQPSGEAGAAA